MGNIHTKKQIEKYKGCDIFEIENEKKIEYIAYLYLSPDKMPAMKWNNNLETLKQNIDKARERRRKQWHLKSYHSA